MIKFYMHKININVKLIILPILTIVAMIALSFIFSQKIQRLKKEVNLIYFGNFVPVHNLHIIKEDLMEIIDKKVNIETNKNQILKLWDEYYKSYKTDEEKKILGKIDSQLKDSFILKTNNSLLKSLDNIEFVIQHEVKSAKIQRKMFLNQYEKMNDILFYCLIAVISFVIGVTSIVIFQAIKQTKNLKNLNDQYKIEANTDALTGLYNRKYFDTIFNQLAPISKSNNWISVFVMIDIDFFKQYNDTYGHDAGDIALKKVAYALDIVIDKDYEYAFRLGGEEFGIIIFNTNEKYIRYTLNNLQHNIKKLAIAHSASATKFLTLSMGVTIIDKSNYHLSTKELYTITDKKLYHSKENGRNQYSF